ncbi:MAG TPA: ORC1-type DNA replication protein [Candidatus Nanoarchaeia archaeon]|nr:ORC1-type DNA replication protein [Candidatus Nanoarchaeia archaeon]
MGDDLTLFLENFIKKEPIFDDKKALQSNYTPINVPYRNKQIQQIAGIFAPALRLEKPSNLFIYGKTGTGKTVSVKHTTNTIMEIANRNNLPLKVIYINCKLKRVADTEYRLVAQLAYEFGKDVPATGLPTDEVYKIFLKVLDSEKKVVILILDEIDQLVNKVGDGILYNLTRINSELKNSQISIIGISNDLMFADNIDPRVKSSLSEEELVFPPYNAIQLQKILRERAKIAFRGGVVAEGVIEKCAAYAAREHGDARRALELLRVAGEIAERKNENNLLVEHIDEAEEKIERDRVLDIITTQPKQFKLTLYSILTTCSDSKGDKQIFTGDVYEVYKDACAKTGVKPLTQRRVSDIIAELDMLGIISARVISKGRYGRTKEISLAIHPSILPKTSEALKEGLNL